MSRLELLRIALRYSFAFGRGYLSTFLSSLSTLGLVLAIGLLIAVLSVMNGFDKEMRERILALVPHITVYGQQPLQDWATLSANLQLHPEIVSAVPFVEFDALFLRGSAIETAIGMGLEPGAGQGLLAALPAPLQAQFAAGEDGLLLGSGLAERLGARVGDTLTLIVPKVGGGGPAATRFASVTLAGVLATGTELDESAAVVHLARAAELAGLDGGVSGLQLQTRDLFEVNRLGWELLGELPTGYYTTNWMLTHGNLYAAIQLSRDLVSILLFSIIAVAAFNVVSSLVLVVFDKQGDIAILRTLGASGGDITWIFILQGAMIGVVGVVLGALCGVLLSLGIPPLVAGLEQLLGLHFLSTDVYPVSFLPVDILLADIALVSAVAFAMCVLAALYPARRAARLAPALILHQERV
ncbi:lipoprotein-releasing ABC transporter permease subunit [Haliea sp. E1-2-M8]|uniref:lipoprotein-releasing ABC transporter permease subunit n=1 Tax=Haliea sp. E1-2-M8 TaxID=3064706 RepID=UPI002720634C|nr:lipoprotein-releasing ABC transporter permease subunit [Haliea sp. E1-2-M8]MDO8862395.1 lipoprotein-releasing ABC transporter permease subunit [Haliea sp. E1-2-M8]